MTETTKKKRKSLALHWKILLFVLASVLGTAFIGLFHDGKPNSTKPEQTSNFYVNDYAHVFSSQTESFIKEQGTLLKERTGVEVVVASVPNTGYEELEEYSIDMAYKWGSRYFDEANGVLILYTIDQPHARIQFGYELEKWLSNEKCKQILNDFTVNAITNQQWNKAAIETWINLVREVYTKYGTDIPKELMVIPEIVEEANTMTDADAELPPSEQKMPTGLLLLVNFGIFWGAVLVLFLIILFMRAIFRWKGWGNPSSYEGASAWHSFGPHNYGGGGGVGGGVGGGGGSGGGASV